MENEQNPATTPNLSAQEQTLLEILENTRKTRNYIKWQLYITVALVVLPLIGVLIMIPLVMSSLGNIGSVYMGGGLQ
jgi:hypothetical protein